MLAVALARKTNGVIVNADSMQLYSGLPVLTAQPGETEMREVPHSLYGFIDPAQRFSTGKWLTAAQAEIKRIQAEGKTPVIVGGTGLYFRVLTSGLADIPDIPASAHEMAQKLYEANGGETFREKLHSYDPASAERLHPSDRQRLIRAYEVVIHTGKPLGDWQAETTKNGATGIDWIPALFMPPRDLLYEQCDNRFKVMLEAGALEEAKAFLARGLAADLPAMKTLGLRELAAHLEGRLGLKEATQKAQQMTRNYAKRQLTWFRNQWLGPKRPFSRDVLVCDKPFERSFINKLVEQIASIG